MLQDRLILRYQSRRKESTRHTSHEDRDVRDCEREAEQPALCLSVGFVPLPGREMNQHTAKGWGSLSVSRQVSGIRPHGRERESYNKRAIIDAQRCSQAGMREGYRCV